MTILFCTRFFIVFHLLCLGTCQSVGCTVEGSHPHEVIDKVNSGDIEIPEVSIAYCTFSNYLRINLDQFFCGKPQAELLLPLTAPTLDQFVAVFSSLVSSHP